MSARKRAGRAACVYRGLRSPEGVDVVVVIEGQEPRPLHHILRHSPGGFEWRYGGSGPADLALSLLADCCGRRVAERHYQSFKWEVVANWPREAFTITADAVWAWLRARLLGAEEARADAAR